MAESIGEVMMDKFVQGVEELRAANAGQMAMDAPPIEAAAPQAEAPQLSSYAQEVNAMAAQAPAPSVEMSIER